MLEEQKITVYFKDHTKHYANLFEDTYTWVVDEPTSETTTFNVFSITSQDVYGLVQVAVPTTYDPVTKSVKYGKRELDVTVEEISEDDIPEADTVLVDLTASN